MEGIDEVIEQVTEALSDVARSDAVVGSPIEVGGVTLLPISRVSVGFAGAGGEGEGEQPAPARAKGAEAGRGKGGGAGSGGGAVVRPVAVVAFRADGVDVLPVPVKQSRLEKLLDQLPELIERFQPGPAR